MELNNRRSIALLILALAIIFSTAGLILKPVGVDGIRVLYNNYIHGEKSAVVKLVVHVPHVEAEKCSIAVYRFPTLLNPVTQGRLEFVGVREVPPGKTVVMSSYIRNADQVSYENSVTKYLEPQEYLVDVKCFNIVKDHTAHTVFLASKVAEVKPTSLLTFTNVYFPRINTLNIIESPRDPGNFSGINNSTVSLCDFSSGDSCSASVGLAYLNSINGLRVRFKIQGTSPESAMYVSSLKSDCIDWDIANCKCNKWGEWYNTGKVLTPSIVTEVSGSFVSNGERGIVYGSVTFHRVLLGGANTGRSCSLIPSWFIYPVFIGGLQHIRMVGNYSVPGVLPGYANGPLYGNVIVYFHDGNNSNRSLGIITRVYFHADKWPRSLSTPTSITVYESGRDDKEYNPPGEVVEDISGRSYGWYYWWFKGNNPYTYELEFYGK
ncbi:MAG: hypothetical protein GSR76_00710 [Desulfurococcales archaeon]|nr:hypothetical protein [Desulfurococcales archaeon]